MQHVRDPCPLWFIGRKAMHHDASYCALESIWFMQSNRRPVSDLGSWEWKVFYGFSSSLSQMCILVLTKQHVHTELILTTVIRTTFPSAHFLASVGRPMAGLTCESMMRIALAVINPLSASVIQVENWWTRSLQLFKASHTHTHFQSPRWMSASTGTTLLHTIASSTAAQALVSTKSVPKKPSEKHP